MRWIDRVIGSQPITPPSLDARIAEIAGRQHGVVARRQLLDAGLGPDAIHDRVRGCRLHLIHRGVYAVGHAAIGTRGRELAAVLACGPGTVLSHQSAAALWELRPPWKPAVHVTAPTAHERDRVVVHRSRTLDPSQVTHHRGIPVTTPARTLLDLAAHLTPRALERALAEAEIRRLTTRGELATLVARCPGRRGARRLNAILTRDAQAPTRSELEERFLAFVRTHALPEPRINQGVHGLEVDFAWPAARLIAELDGFAYHSTRDAFERDRARDATLQAAGWRVVRITHRRLAEQPREVARLLTRLLRPPPAPAHGRA